MDLKEIQIRIDEAKNCHGLVANYQDKLGMIEKRVRVLEICEKEALKLSKSQL